MSAYLLSALPAKVRDPVHMFPVPVEGGLGPEAAFYHNRAGRVVISKLGGRPSEHTLRMAHRFRVLCPILFFPSSVGIMQAHLFRPSLRGLLSLWPNDV